jgi:hypothetical protein
MMHGVSRIAEHHGVPESAVSRFNSAHDLANKMSERANSNKDRDYLVYNHIMAQNAHDVAAGESYSDAGHKYHTAQSAKHEAKVKELRSGGNEIGETNTNKWLKTDYGATVAAADNASAKAWRTQTAEDHKNAARAHFDAHLASGSPTQKKYHLEKAGFHGGEYQHKRDVGEKSSGIADIQSGGERYSYANDDNAPGLALGGPGSGPRKRETFTGSGPNPISYGALRDHANAASDTAERTGKGVDHASAESAHRHAAQYTADPAQIKIHQDRAAYHLKQFKLIGKGKKYDQHVSPPASGADGP